MAKGHQHTPRPHKTLLEELKYKPNNQIGKSMQLSSNQKRKSSTVSPNEPPSGEAELVAVDLEDPLSALRRLAYLCQTPEEDPPCTTAARRDHIFKSKDRMQELLQLKGAINACVDEMRQKEDTKVNALYDSLSPLLSLGGPILVKILGHLDEEAIYAAEQASFALASVILEHQLWEPLYDNWGRNKSYGNVFKPDLLPYHLHRFYMKDTTVTKRRCEFDKTDNADVGECLNHGQQFEQAEEGTKKIAIMRCLAHYSTIASNLELLGEQYYNYANCNESSSFDISERNKLAFHPNLGGYHSMIVSAQKNAFLRISRIPALVDDQIENDIDGPPVLALQGFVNIKRLTSNPRGFQLGVITGVKEGEEHCWHFSWPELEHFSIWMQQATEAQLRSEYQQRARSTFQGLRVSFVMADKKPLLTTGGLERVELVSVDGRDGVGTGVRAWLHSRYDRDDKDANNCSVVETTLSVFAGPGEGLLLLNVAPKDD